MIGKLIKALLKVFIYFLIICIIGAINIYLLIPTFIIFIIVIYKKGIFTKLIIKRNIKKKYGTIKFINKINLTEWLNNEFDKNLLNYKNNYICLTKEKIIFVGYVPTIKMLNKIYMKDFSIKNIEEIDTGLIQKEYKYDKMETKVSYRTITRGNYSYDEEVREQVPVEATGIGTYFSHITIKFKDVNEKNVMFDFGKQKILKETEIPLKFKKICYKIGIKKII